MSDFNYQEYLKNNPLLKEEEVKDQLITESQTESNIEEAENNQYDELIGGIIRRLHDLQKYVETNEPSKSEDLQAIVDALNKFDEFMAYGENLEEAEEVSSSKMKVSELKAKIKEDILSILSEADEEEVVGDEEVDAEVDAETDVEEPTMDAPTGEEGLTADEKEIQDSLKLAYDNATAIGDTKLADQIGNSITFFTRTHVVER